jgi:hypothetical protein
MGTPHEVAKAVVLLASADSSVVNGVELLLMAGACRFDRRIQSSDFGFSKARRT